MSKYRLMIADSDEGYTRHLEHCLSQSDALTLVGVCNSGADVMSKIRSAKPDILLMDPILPGMDGVSILKQLRGVKSSVHTVVCQSQFFSATSIELARRYGAAYYMYKPVDPQSLFDVLVGCADVNAEAAKMRATGIGISRNDELGRATINLMHELGFSSRHTGSAYIARSVAIVRESPMAMHNLSTGLYPRLAEEMSTTPANVERSIRTAVSHANSDNRLARRIGDTPTNKAVLRYISRMVENA